MLITEREAETICIALMALKTPDGLMTSRGSDLAFSVMAAIKDTGRFTFEVEKEL